MVPSQPEQPLDWEADVFRALHGTLIRILTDPASVTPTSLSQLQTALNKHQHSFRRLLHEPPRDERLKQNLDSGNVTIRGKVHQANKAFCQAVGQVADVLDIHEARAAALYNTALAQRALFGDVSDVEASVLIYYAEREYLLNCVEAMLVQYHLYVVNNEALNIVSKFTASFMDAVPQSGSAPADALPMRLIALLSETEAQILKAAESVAAARKAPEASQASGLAGLNQQQPQQQSNASAAHQRALESRLRHMLREQHFIAALLIQCAHKHGLTATELSRLIQRLRSMDGSERTFHYLQCAVLAQLDSSSPAHQSPSSRFVLDDTAYRNLHESILSGPWTIEATKGATWLAWLAFLDAYSRSAALTDVNVRAYIAQEIDGSRRTWFDKFGKDPSSFNLLRECLQPGRSTAAAAALDAAGTQSASGPGAGQQLAVATPSSTRLHDSDGIARDIRKDVTSLAVQVVESLVRSVVLRMKRNLRQMMTADQDTAASQEQQEQQQPHLAGGSQAPHNTQLTSWESLLLLLKESYHDRPDSAADWLTQNDLFGILKMASEAWTPRFIIAFLDLLAAIASGPVSALQTHNILNSDHAAEFGPILWSTFFRTLTSYIGRLNQPVQAAELQPAEMRLIAAFLRLLARVVRSSFTARRVLCENQHFRALQTLFQLLVCRIQVDMKAELLLAIAAFCHPSKEGAEIVQQVWMLLEQSQIVPTTSAHDPVLALAGPAAGRRVAKPGEMAPSNNNDGIAYDLHEIETSMQTYPETRAFLALLEALLSNPQSTMLTSVYENLGAPERLGGVRPYIRFVMDDVLLRTADRPFANPDERWKVTGSCLKILELAVQLFDMSELQLSRDSDLAAGPGKVQSSMPISGSAASAASTRMGSVQAAGPQASIALVPARAPARALALHPGFEVLSRVLEGSRFSVGLFHILSLCIAHLDAMDDASTASLLNWCIASALRIFHGILSNQRAFLELLAPALVDLRDNALLGLPISMVGLDQLLAYNKRTIVEIALLVSNPDASICRASIDILAILSTSSVFTAVDGAPGSAHGRPNRLVSILEASEESNVILQGYVDLLDIEVDEEEDLADGDMVELPDSSLEMPGNRQTAPRKSIRCAILDMLISNLTHQATPNLAHFLLGFDCHQDIATTELRDPAAPDARRNCLHAILSLLSRDVPRISHSQGDQQHHDGYQMDDDLDSPADSDALDRDSRPLSVTHPLLSEKCFRLIFLLCSDRTTGTPTMRYLRTREDFFLRQIVALNPAAARSSGDRLPSPPVLVARLHQQAWLMRTITLELHMTAISGQRTHNLRLMNHLMGLNDGMDGATHSRSTGGQQFGMEMGLDMAAYNQHVEYEQSLAKAMDLLKMMDFSEPARQDQGSSQLMQAFALHEFVRVDERGVDQYDVRAIYLGLIAQVHHAERQMGRGRGGGSSNGLAGMGGSSGAVMDRDMVNRLTETLFSLNEVHRLASARFEIAMAWGQLIRTAVIECFDTALHELRQLRLFELLDSLLQKLSKGDASMPIGKALSEVVTGLMARIQQDSRTQTIFEQTALSIDRSKLDSWQQAILRGLLDGMLVPGTSLAMRGNYYAALITYIQYICPQRNLKDGSSRTAADDGALGASDGRSDAINRINGLLASMTIIHTYGDRLIEVICRDASDGELVWQTVAFSTLASLCGLCNLESSVRGTRSNHIIDFLVRRNFLGHFVQTLKTVDDVNLRSLLTSTDSSNTKYVYDLKMALLLKIAETKMGADRLLSIGLLETLTDCQFVNERPDYGGYDVATEQEWYHDMIVPVLELIVSIQRHHQTSNTAVRAKVSHFIEGHQEVFAAILRDRVHKITLSSLTQVRLCTSILGWMRGDHALLSKRIPGPGQSSFDDLMLQLFQKYVLAREWRSQTVAVSELEQEKARTVPPKVFASATASSLFAMEVEVMGEKIAVNLLTYLIEKSLPGETLADRGAQPVSLLKLLQDRSAGGDAILGKTLGLIQTLGNRLVQASTRRKNIQMKIADISQVPVDEINEIARSFNRSAFEELSPSQRRTVAGRDLCDADSLVAKEIQRLQALVEMAAFLFLQLARGLPREKKAAAIMELEQLAVGGADRDGEFIKLCVRSLLQIE
ncbi:nucleoporin Nup186/Nup192/Nup205 [Entophlyctis helioformis]|nr:nucleoporin Nup186/Nup192/Nup205 [Entophlyctis helioformis]